ncbi:heme A synthase [Cyanobacterium stanieri LEGE 03274]|uniref:Heme A synthase n=1 Tax=Cyanobacterium stanieri LEGE 03274 TaxID=1828756 RepID=A0ABR9V1J5_9CHRO|nr:heme A synthase [Cyanobacterium stanieri]MBE9221750.1 heme A synthase [Cyanobacterium stanieri LEGE 03274]
MTESILYTSIPRSSQPSKPIKWVLWLVWKMAIATLLLMAIGAATRVMNAGLACPDWPLCYGQVIPTNQMNLQVFLEWFHRLDASFIGLSAIALTGLSWWKKSALPRWLPWASTFALCLIVFQGILGGLTVTQLLRFDIVTAHLGTALLFFATLVIIGSKLSPYQGTATVGNLKAISIIASILVYIQCILGGLVASQWAAHQCFVGKQLCLVMNSHIIGVLPPTITTLLVIILSWRTPALAVKLRNLAKIIALLLLSQILLGIATFYLHLQVEPLTIAHHTIGAALFGSLVSFSVFASRDGEVSYQ